MLTPGAGHRNILEKGVDIGLNFQFSRPIGLYAFINIIWAWHRYQWWC